MPEASIIIPTRNRAQYLLERFRILEKNTPEISSGIAEVIICLDEDDLKTCEVVDMNFPRFRLHFNPKLAIPCDKWNEAARKYKESKWLITVSDDSVPHPGWLTNALNILSRGFIALPDGKTGDRNLNFTPLYMATRQWLRSFNGGYLVPPYYKSWYGDMEIAEKAHRSGTYILAESSIVEQLHFDFGTAANDEIYDLGRSRRLADLKTYEQRKKEGFIDKVRGDI